MTYEIPAFWDIVYCILSDLITNFWTNWNHNVNGKSLTMVLWITFTVTTDISKTDCAATSWRKASACGWRCGSVGSVFVDAGCTAGASEATGASDATSDVAAGSTAGASSFTSGCAGVSAAGVVSASGVASADAVTWSIASATSCSVSAYAGASDADAIASVTSETAWVDSSVAGAWVAVVLTVQLELSSPLQLQIDHLQSLR